MKMRSIITTALVLGLAGAAAAAEVEVGVDAASAYVFRGVTFNDGFVAQPYMEVSGPIVLGVWANYDIDDYDGAANDGQVSEVDLYASYALPLDLEIAEFTIGYTEYTYPGSGGDAELNDAGEAEGTFGESDREASIGVALGLPLSPSATFFYGVDGGIEEDMYFELGLEHEFELAEGLALGIGATVGYYDPEAEDAEDGFSHYTASASLSYGVVSAGVTYYGQIDDEVLPDGAGAYDVEVVGTLGVSCGF